MVSSIDLSGFATAELTFDWLIESGFDSGEYLALDISTDGGATWQNDVRRLRGNVEAENTWHSETVDLIPFASANTLVRFRAKVSRSNEDANVDNVRITGVLPSGPSEITIDDAILTEPGSLEVFAAAGSGGLERPSGVAFGPDGDLYVSSRSSNDNVLRFDGTTGQFLDEFVSSGSGGLNDPGAIVFGPDGHLYVINQSQSNVLRYDGVSGSFLGEFVISGDGGLDVARGLSFDSAGDLFVTNFSPTSTIDSVLKYDGATGDFVGVFVAVGSGGLLAPKDLTFGPDGNLYVGSGGTDSILRYDGVTGDFIDEFIPSAAGGLVAPTSGVFGLDGFFYVGGGQSNSIIRFDGTTGEFVDHIVPSGQAGLDNPQMMAFGSDGSLYVANRLVDEVVRYSHGLNVSLSAPSTEAVTVDYSTSDSVPTSAVAGLDYTAISGTLTFAAGDVTKKVLLTTVDDAIHEGGETFQVTLSSATIRDENGVATILDDDPPPANDPPQAFDDAASTDEDVAVAIDVISNDSDPNGDPLTVDSVTQAANGLVAINGSHVVYTPNPNHNGVDLFTYTVIDGNGASDTATVTVSVAPVN